MPQVEVFITWPGDERRIVIEGRLSPKAFEFLKDQLKDERELINVAGIRPVTVQVGPEEEDFRDQRERARATNNVGEVFDEVADVVDDDDEVYDDDDEEFELEAETPADVNAAALNFRMPFGKHSGMTLWEIAQEFPDYLDWCAGNFNGTRDVDLAVQKAVRIPKVAALIDKAVNER